MTPIRATLAAAARQLRSLPQASPGLESELLLCSALKRPRSYLYAWPERGVQGAALRRFGDLLQRRLRGEPLAYVLGRREFWSLELEVTPATLIPRPETELLVELALGTTPPDQPRRVADLGTGCGAVAAAVASERPGWTLLATDRSPDALTVARRNFRRLGLTNIAVRQGDWFSTLRQGERFELLLSNPPYVAAGDAHLNQGDLPWEPQRALLAGADGLDAIRTLISGGARHLQAGGYLWLEHGNDQGAVVRELFGLAGYCQPRTHRDLAGRERITGACIISPRE